MRRNLLVFTLLVAALLAPAGAAWASTSQITSFEAPRDLLDPATRASALDEIGSLGVHSLRIVVYWHDVAPSKNSRVKPKFDATDPAKYDWSRYDPVLDAAKERGWSVLMTLSGPVPRWATNGARNTVTRPSPNEFRMFVTAAARHFADRVTTWSIWNEPNHPEFLGPQFSSNHRPTSPTIYRNLYFAAIRGFAAAGSKAPVLVGETAPRGTGKVVAPLTFLRGVLCLNSSYHRSGKCQKLPAAGYAHHAYTTRDGPSFKPPGPNDVTIGVLSRLTRALDRAASAGRIAKHMPIWLTEFGIQSKPDPLIGVSLAKQAEYQAISERIAYDNPRVVAFSQYLLRDDKPVPGPSIARYSGFESGLETSGGKAKPSLAGFRLPLAAKLRGSRVSLWGLVRPSSSATQAVLFYADPKQSFRKLRTVTTNARGFWSLTTGYRSGRRFRVEWTAPDGSVFRGPPIRAYR
ncbi:MAG: hypothetical protein QOH62_2417 [Solirubrobacteraceae bacterium]|nr:hypothetical protein [Solirubrobacteraceae bacterium]